MMAGHLHAIAQIGKSIEQMAAIELPEMNRTVFGLEEGRGALRIEPELYLAFHAEREIETREQRMDPTSHRQDQLSRAIFALGGGDFNAVAIRFPTQDRLLAAQRGAVFPGQPEMRREATFGEQDARARFQNRHHVVRGTQGWESS